MSIFFIDGFDHYFFDGVGGRKWDQGSSAAITSGRWGAFAIEPGGSGNVFITQWDGAHRVIPPCHELIVGFAMNVTSFAQQHPFLMFMDGSEVQCSFHINSETNTFVLRTGRGLAITDFQLADTGFIAPLTLWFYIEIKMTIGGVDGAVEVRINGQTVLNVSGIQTQQTGNNFTSKIAFCSTLQFGNSPVVDDLYLMNTEDGHGFTDFIGEIRVQSRYTDANGFEDDFLASTGLNYQNVQIPQTQFLDSGVRNTSSAAGALDLYSIDDFVINSPGQIFAVQGDLVSRKEDVGIRTVCPIIRTLSTTFEGTPTSCYSDYTYSGQMWEYNPSTNLQWTVGDLNDAQFGIKIKT